MTDALFCRAVLQTLKKNALEMYDLHFEARQLAQLRNSLYQISVRISRLQTAPLAFRMRGRGLAGRVRQALAKTAWREEFIQNRLSALASGNEAKMNGLHFEFYE